MERSLNMTGSRSSTTIRVQEHDPGSLAGSLSFTARPCNWPGEQVKVAAKTGHTMAERQDSDDESRRIIERVARETDPGGTS
ncbi:MAG: hypothetical protein E5W00_19975, partial [Mesorhizobium sp.]